MRAKTLLTLLLLGLAAPAWSAINPEHYQRIASETLRIRETGRVVVDTQVGGERLRRVTLLGEVIQEVEASQPLLGKTVVIDYTVNLSEREAAAAAHAERSGNRPGPQFMHEPDAPALDADGAYWANVARAGGRLGNVNRHAGAVVGIDESQYSGLVFVPVAGQYSFDAPPR